MKIVIFFRKHNDLDHGLPIVDHLVRNKKQYVEVYGVREDYKSCDKHLNYLKNKLSLKVNSFEHVYNSKMDSMIISAITRIKLLSELLPKNIIGTIISIFKHNIVRLLEYMASGPVKRFVSTLESDSVVLVDYGTESLYPFRYILKHCKQKNIELSHTSMVIQSLPIVIQLKSKNHSYQKNSTLSYSLNHLVSIMINILLVLTKRIIFLKALHIKILNNYL